MCISWIILYLCDIVIFYITLILYLFVGGHKCHITTFPTSFAHAVYGVVYTIVTAPFNVNKFCSTSK